MTVSGATANIINVPADHQTIQAGIDAANDADTVLVQPGNYQENISFDGKNIIVGSLYLTTQDTSYISQTVIDGGQNGSVVRFIDGEDSTAVLIGFSLTNGNGTLIDQFRYGGGIYCNNSSPKVTNVIITGNTGAQFGGGITCLFSSPNLLNVTITGNTAEIDGGGISSIASEMSLSHSTISKNTAKRGGGMFFEGSTINIEHGIINGNKAAECGGGLYFKLSSPFLDTVLINGNSAEVDGGGMFCENSNLEIASLTISHNSSEKSGGGIYCDNSSTINFDRVNRCNIYLNRARVHGRDLYSDNSSTMFVVVDTFTVNDPCDYYANPVDRFTFNILNDRIKNEHSELYVSIEGDDTNTGQSPSVPFRTISTALSIIIADSLHPRTIYLSDGVYSPSTNGELFPLSMVSYVSISGESESGVILNAEGESSVLFFDKVCGIAIEKLIITGSNYGSGIYCIDSSPRLVNITISGNTAEDGGGIHCRGSSSPILEKVIISENTASRGGGMYCNNSSPILENVVISDNTAKWGGGISCHNNSYPVLSNVTITGNIANNDGGGIYLDRSSMPIFDSDNRCNIYSNNAMGYGKDLYSDNSQTIDVVVDTFTVINPKDFHAYPADHFTFVILNAKVEPLNSDLYVSPDGDDTNSGRSSYEPLRTISLALSIIIADSLHPRTIYLSEGKYSPYTNGELFPLTMLSYVSLSGVSENNVILDAEGQRSVLFFDNIQGITIEKLTITGSQGDGGIYCNLSNPRLVNITISRNTAEDGGGINCRDSSNPILENVIISENTASRGGGIYCHNSSLELVHVTISDNTAVDGGGMHCYESELSLLNVTISGNAAYYKGGGMYCYESDPSLSNVTITRNTAGEKGGGMYFSSNSNPSFDPDNRCNIYYNHAPSVNDLYADNYSTIAVVVDTFTVMNPTDYHTYPLDNFTFDILQAVVQQVAGNLYVSPYGDDANTGHSPFAPVRTISCALSKIIADNLNPHAIYLSDGVYSPSTNGESFPLSMVNYVSLVGESEGGVILDAEGKSDVLYIFYGGVIYCNQIRGISIENCTITGGNAGMGGGLYCSNSSIVLSNVTIYRNVAEVYAGGISGSNSSILLTNMTIYGNDGGGICFRRNSSINLVNTIMWNNIPFEIFLIDTCSIAIAYSDIQKGGNGIDIYKSTVNWLEGNSDYVPCFVDPTNGDFHLQVGSPCIDAGTAFFVYEGDTLVNISPNDYAGSAPDMGALEFGAEENTPLSFSLHQNFPNPFNSATIIGYTIAENSKVSLAIYNVMGQEVRTLVDNKQLSGYYSVIWDGRDNAGRVVSSGIYIYRLQTSGEVKSKKMLLLK